MCDLQARGLGRQDKRVGGMVEPESEGPDEIDHRGGGVEEEDQFSFFTADGLVRRDSELTVNSDGKIMIRVETEETPDTPPQSTNTQERKRSLDEAQTKLEVPDNDDNNNHEDIEYVGLVKRPKTPLITTKDIQKQVAQISERKQSGCGSLPDVISSSVETPATELHLSRLVAWW